MNTETAQKLCDLTSDFYRVHAASFSATRHAPWSGWTRCLDEARRVCTRGGGPGARGDVENVGKPSTLSVLDLACGNLRFEAFLTEAFPETDFILYAVDNCEDLVSAEAAQVCGPLAEAGMLASAHEKAAFRHKGHSVDGDLLASLHATVSVARRKDSRHSTRRMHYQNLDIASALVGDSSLGNLLEAPACDLAVSFGFLHHVPLPSWRAEVLSALVDHAHPGGFVFVSLWRFMDDAKLAKKARASHARAADELGLPALDEGDYLLGWKNIPGAYRYCHSFSDIEIDALVAAVADRATLIARFNADGRTGDLNTYLVLQV